MEELMVKKSIFTQKQKMKEYCKTYRYGYDGGAIACVDYKYIDVGKEYKYECELSMPLLNINDFFYIEEDDKIIQISSVIRTSKDNVLYVCCDDVVENEDEYLKVKHEVEQEIKEIEKNKKIKVDPHCTRSNWI